MLTFQWRSTITDAPTTTTIADANPDLAIRNLLDDPRLRQAMETVPAAPAPVAAVLPEPVLNRRRLLERAAA